MNTNQALDFDRDVFMDDYARGMDMLNVTARAFSMMAGGIGYPIPNTNIPTARVMVDLDSKRVAFEINPHFIRDLKDSEIAAVIAHETYHVLLNHLSDLTNTATYPDQQALIHAQECIINDGLPANVGFTTPEGTLRGMELYNQDFSLFSTKEGYDFIVNQQKEENEDSEDSSDDKGEGGDNTSSDSGDSSNDESNSENADDSAASDSNGEGSEADAADGHGPICAGPSIVGEDIEKMTPEELADAVKAVIGKAVSDASDEMNTKGEDADGDLMEMIDELQDAGVEIPVIPNFGNANAPKNAFATVSNISGMNLNWVELLAIINPKIKSSGRAKVRDSWHAPRRRMLHSYPDLILPTRKRQDNSNKKRGDSVPTFILALDMSGSIPTHLLKDLAALAQSVPEKLIKAFPITWSDNYRIYDVNQPNAICARGGTRIAAVHDYAERVKQETGVEPYVLVITDGGFSVPYYLEKEAMSSKWYWMAIQSNDKRMIQGAVSGIPGAVDKIFDMKDFV